MVNEYYKTFRLKDPYSYWGDHHFDWHHRKYKTNTSVHDTGFCNRLLTWETAYTLIQKSNQLLERKILCQKRIFPELELLSLPITYLIDYNTNLHKYNDTPEADLLHHLTYFDTEAMQPKKASPITKNEVQTFMFAGKTSFQLRDNHIYNDWGGFLNLYDNHVNFHKISIKDEYLNSLLFGKSESMVGIHIRKGNGVGFTDKDLNTFPKELRTQYTDRKGTKRYECEYPFIEDEVYFRLIDSILKVNENQKFFISHDLPDVFIDEYYTRFGKNIISSRKDYRDIFIGRYKELGIDYTSIQNYCNGVDNIIDLFGLSYCGFIVQSDTSTWSQFACGYRRKNAGKHATPIKSDGYGGFDTEHILTSYKNKINKILL